MGGVTLKTTFSPSQYVSLMASDTNVTAVGTSTVNVIELVVDKQASGSMFPPSSGKSYTNTSMTSTPVRV